MWVQTLVTRNKQSSDPINTIRTQTRQSNCLQTKVAPLITEALGPGGTHIHMFAFPPSPPYKVAPAVSSALPIVINIGVNASDILHQANPLYMGCHSDSGFVHEVTGWSSQMLFGESFERPPSSTAYGQSSYSWQNVIDGSGSAALDPSNNFSSWPSMRLEAHSGGASNAAGVANRGLGNEGLFLRAGMPYEGYFFVHSDSPVKLEVRLTGGANFSEVLAVKHMLHTPRTVGSATDTKANTGWVRKQFTLTPSKGADCVGIAPGEDTSVHCTNNPGTAHICVRCAGQLVVSVLGDESGAASAANIAYVVLQPGEWGRFKGLNARRDVAETLMTMGVKAIRLGGSFVSVAEGSGTYYQWQRWTGPVWERQSIGAHWDSYNQNAYNLIGGWGPFEMIDYAAALGAEPIITTTKSSSPAELADLVEYCWGNSTTTFGSQRLKDGHADPYKLRFIELGNEQYNSDFVSQVEAMESRANAVGVPNELHYIFPSNGGVTGKDVAAAAALKLGPRLVSDIHVGAEGGLEEAAKLFSAHTSGGLTDDAAVNLETNAGTHSFGRALDEAADLNAFFNAGNRRLLARTASFCHGRSGHFDEFDQAISFFLPNMTWLQPPGHVHAMITSSWQPQVINSSITASGLPRPSWSAVRDKGLTCAGAEYRGVASPPNRTAAGCLAAVEEMASEGINFAIFPGNGNCYVCAISGDIDSRLENRTGAVSFIGKNIIEPMSVSAQLSADGKTLIARVVNHGTPKSVTLSLTGFMAATAEAMTLVSDNLSAENTPADVDHVAPKPLDAVDCKAEGSTVMLVLPGLSYTVVTVSA